MRHLPLTREENEIRDYRLLDAEAVGVPPDRPAVGADEGGLEYAVLSKLLVA